MTDAQREAARRATHRADIALARELLHALRRNQSDRHALRRQVRALLQRVEREGV